MNFSELPSNNMSNNIMFRIPIKSYSFLASYFASILLNLISFVLAFRVKPLNMNNNKVSIGMLVKVGLFIEIFYLVSVDIFNWFSDNVIVQGSNYLCQFSNFIQNFSSFLDRLAIMVILLDRSVFLMSHKSSRRFFTKMRLKIGFCFSIGISFAMYFNYLFMFAYRTTGCSLIYDFYNIGLYLDHYFRLFTFTFIFPLITMICVVVMTFSLFGRKIRYGHIFVSNDNQTNNNNDKTDNRSEDIELNQKNSKISHIKISQLPNEMNKNFNIKLSILYLVIGLIEVSADCIRLTIYIANYLNTNLLTYYHLNLAITVRHLLMSVIILCFLVFNKRS